LYKSQPTDDKLSLIGAWSGHVTHYLFSYLIEYYLYTKFHRNRRNFLWTDGNLPPIVLGRLPKFGSRPNKGLIISTVFLKLKDFSRIQAVTYTVNVVITQTTNRKCYVTLSDLQDYSSTAILSKCDLVCFWQDFKRRSASRGPSVIADVLVTY